MKLRPFDRAGAVLLVACISLLAGTLKAQTNTPQAVAGASADSLPETVYLFTSFRGNGDGLHLAWSTDGLKWNAIPGDPVFLRPQLSRESLMRDPCILQGPDGTFHMVWTTGWTQKTIGYASSRDLIHWSEQKAIPVMEHEPTARNSWAPEIIYNPQKQEYVIFWATTIPGRFPTGEESGDGGYNHRIYCTTTKDFQAFTPTRLFYDPGFNVIDATIVPDGSKYHMVVKDETRNPPKKHLRATSGDSIEGPWEPLREPFTPAGVWVEGPTVLKVGDHFYCYYDEYRDRRYGAMRTTDFKAWENVTDQLSMPRGTRHGTAFPVKREVLVNLLNAQPATQPAANP